jgi:hypothetical protein
LRRTRRESKMILGAMTNCLQTYLARFGEGADMDTG